MSYLESEVPNLADVYDLAIVGYALQLSGSTQADAVWRKLDAKAKIEGFGFMLFVKRSQDITQNFDRKINKEKQKQKDFQEIF